MALVVCGMVPLAAPAEVVLIDPGNPLYDVTLAAGNRIVLARDNTVHGDLHSNNVINMRPDTLVTGDVSAVDRVRNPGTIQGTLTEGADPVTLPTLPTEAEMRALADREIEGNTVFIDEAFDDVVFVDGRVVILGALTGTGTVLATGNVVVRTNRGNLDPEAQLSIVSQGTIRIARDRPFRGFLRAGNNINLSPFVAFEGVAIANNVVWAWRGVESRFLERDTVAPTVTLVEPLDGAELEVSPTAIVATWMDDGSGIDPTSGAILLDTVDRTTDASVSESGITLPLTTELAEGSHTVEVQVRDLAGNQATASFSFTILGVSDQTPPELTILSPTEGLLTNQSLLTVTGTATDDVEVASVLVNGVVADLIDDTYSAVIELLGSGPRRIDVVASDTSGKETALSVTIALDMVTPDLMFQEPTSGLVTHGASIVVSGGAEDMNGIAAIEVNGEVVPFADEMFETTVDLVDGSNDITVVAEDGAGNRTTETRQVIRIALPEVAITAPQNQSLVSGSSVVVEGLINDPGATVEVEGVPATLSGGTFSATVPLSEGVNLLTATAVGSLGRAVTATISVVRDTTPPTVVISSPTEGAETRQPTVSITGLVNDAAGGFDTLTDVAVTVNGVPATVDNGSFLLPDLALTPGDNTVTAVAVDAAGNSAQTLLQIRYDDSPGERLAVVSGNHQTATVSEALALPLVVELTDLAGQPLVGETLHLSVVEGNGALDGSSRQTVATTDASGRAAIGFTLGTRAGSGNHRVRVWAPSVGQSLELSASATAAAPAHVLVDNGDQQQGIAGQPLPHPFSAVVTDGNFNRLAGVDVLFRVVAGGGAFADGSAERVVTSDSQGVASAVLTLGPEDGTANNAVWAMVGQDPDDPLASFAASGRSAGDSAATAIVGLVLDNTDLPVPGVTVEIVESGQATQTDATGFFRIASAPVGTLHLHVESSTATRPGTWSSLEFQMVTIPGRDNDLGRPIYILPLDTERGLDVSATEGGTLTLPELPGFALDVEPGSVTFPGGGQTGTVSVTLVHSDKVPMVPNFGQQPRFVITIQPSGAVFDPPARITFPNVDGMAPGQVTELYSFDHDLGRFVSIGPGAISEDGASLVSMPGFGIVKAGWHCGGDPADSGTPHGCPDCQECVENVCVPDPGQHLDPCEDDGNRCTVDFCLFGNCVHWRKRIDEVDAKANGEDSTTILVGGCVDFSQTTRAVHCTVDFFTWDFGNGSGSTDPAPTACYPDPGNYQYRLDVGCDSLCAQNNDSGSVEVKCPDVTITESDPNIDILCPGCDMQFTVETDPPNLPVSWDYESDIGEFIDLDDNGFLMVDADAPKGEVLVKAYSLHEDCSDERSIFVFAPPTNEPRDPDTNRSPAEDQWIRDNLFCAAIHKNLGSRANRERRKAFPNCQGPNPPSCCSPQGLPNAFYHAFGSCVVAANCGESVSKDLFDGHEEYDTNTCVDANMDFHNNDQGRKIARGLGLIGQGNVPPDDVNAQCAAGVAAAARAGNLRWQDPPPGDNTCPMIQDDVPPGSPCLP